MLNPNSIRLLTSTPEVGYDRDDDCETDVLYALDTDGVLWSRQVTWQDGHISDKTKWERID